MGYIVGSLAKASINRKLAKALERLAPDELKLTEIPIKDLPLYSYDYDANFPEVAIKLKKSHRGFRRRALRDAGIQPLDSRRTQERDRLGEPAVRQELVHAEAHDGDRNLAGKDRHRHCPAAIA